MLLEDEQCRPVTSAVPANFTVQDAAAAVQERGEEHSWPRHRCQREREGEDPCLSRPVAAPRRLNVVT